MTYYRERFGRKAERRDELAPLMQRALAGDARRGDGRFERLPSVPACGAWN